MNFIFAVTPEKYWVLQKFISWLQNILYVYTLLSYYRKVRNDERCLSTKKTIKHLQKLYWYYDIVY